MQILLFDDATRNSLLPFTHTRPIADIRCGIWTMRERWEQYLHHHTGTLTAPYLQKVFPQYTDVYNDGDDLLLINGAVFGSLALVDAIYKLQPGQKLVKDNILIALCTNNVIPEFDQFEHFAAALVELHYEDTIHALQHVWDIFQQNDRAIRDDFETVTDDRKSAAIPDDVIVSGRENLFIEEGANIYAGCIINASTGPVYIGRDCEVLEGALIRGPLAMGDHSVIKMGAKIYGATTLGPGCKVGGEINNTVFFANSNKAHDGYLGNAVIGEWCNLGADTNCSNLKNNYAEVEIWDEYRNRPLKTGLTFCGLLMGDHSKCGINTMFNTGTVVGVSCNLYGAGFPEKFVPSFCWGSSDDMTTYKFSRAIDTASRMMARRNKALSLVEIDMYEHIFNQTQAKRDLFAATKK